MPSPLMNSSGSTPPAQMVAPPTRKPEELLKQQENAAEFVSWVKTQFEAAKKARIPHERKWALNYAFYKGKQYMQFFPAAGSSALAGKLWTPPAPNWSARSVTNRIKPIIRTEIARLVSNKPNASAVPASSEDADLFAAQAAEQAWQVHYREKKIARTFSSAVFWMTICGTAFVKDWYDEKRTDNITQEMGSIEYGAVSPYFVYVPDLLEENLEEQAWLINAYTKPVEWIKSVYGIDVNPNTISAESPYKNSVMDMSTSANQNNAKPDSTEVIEIWIKPGQHKWFPKGCMATIIDDRVVQSVEEWPYAHNEYPFTKFDHIPTGEFYADSVIVDLIAPQREYNRTKNQIIESKNRMSKPQLLAPEGSVQAAKITTEPGQIIFYRPGLDAPRPLPLQPIPGYVLQQLDREIADMEDISSQHQVSRGQAPPGVTAATAISFMSERDDSLLTTAYQSIEWGWEKIANHTVSHIRQFWNTKRLIKVTGVDGAFDSITLLGSEISQGTVITVEAGSAMPESKAARQAFIMDMMKMQFIDPNKGLELLEMGGVQKLTDELKVDERQAQRENIRMARLDIGMAVQQEQIAEQQNMIMQEWEQTMAQVPPGVDPATLGIPPAPPGMVDPNTGAPLQMPANIVPVNTWDNHQLHIDVHNRYRKSQQYDLLPEEIKRQFEAHVQQHAFALNAAAQAAMAMPPPQDNGMSADNGSGTPVGMNQFGPPGTQDGAPPPDAGGGNPEGMA